MHIYAYICIYIFFFFLFIYLHIYVFYLLSFLLIYFLFIYLFIYLLIYTQPYMVIVTRLTIDHWILKARLSVFNFQIYFESSISFEYFTSGTISSGCGIFAWTRWLLYLCIFSFRLCQTLSSHWTFGSGRLQLHFRVSSFVVLFRLAFCVSVRLLCLRIKSFMLSMQL